MIIEKLNLIAISVINDMAILSETPVGDIAARPQGLWLTALPQLPHLSSFCAHGQRPQGVQLHTHMNAGAQRQGSRGESR
jgi:hypothetical protein